MICSPAYRTAIMTKYFYKSLFSSRFPKENIYKECFHFSYPSYNIDVKLSMLSNICNTVLFYLFISSTCFQAENVCVTRVGLGKDKTNYEDLPDAHVLMQVRTLADEEKHVVKALILSFYFYV